MAKQLLTNEEIRRMKSGGKSTAKLHPDEMILGGDSRYINPKFKLPKKAAATKSKTTLFGL